MNSSIEIFLYYYAKTKAVPISFSGLLFSCIVRIFCKYRRKLHQVNSEVRGFYNYYSIACNASTLNHFSSLMKYSMLKTFGAKYRMQVSKVKDKYVKNGDFTVPYETKDGPKESVYYNQGFHWKKEAVFGQVDVIDKFKRYDKPNSLAARLRTKVCELCHKDCDSIEMHQIKRLKDLKGQSEWEIVMRKRRRKTLAVCHECHEKIHDNDDAVSYGSTASRMR